MKVFDHDAKYTDEEYREFFRLAITDEFMERNLMNFFYGGMDKIDPEKKQRILNGTEPVITPKPPFSYETLKKVTNDFLKKFKFHA